MILNILNVVLLVVLSVATYGLYCYHDKSMKSLWGSGWGARLDALMLTAGLLLTISNLLN